MSELREQDAAVLGELSFSSDDAWEIGFWNRLSDWLKAPPGALSDRERVELLLEVANGKGLTGAQLNALTGATMVRVRGADSHKILPPPTARSWVERGVVAALTPTARRRVFANSARECNGQVVLVPDLGASGKYRIIAHGPLMALTYSIMILTDDRGEFASKLLRCPYSRCKRFFLKRTGLVGPPLKACTKEHGRLADNEKAVDRMRRRRL